MEQMCMRFFLMRVNFFFQMHHYVQEAVLIRTNDYSFSIFFIRVREKDLVRFFSIIQHYNQNVSLNLAL